MCATINTNYIKKESSAAFCSGGLIVDDHCDQAGGRGLSLTDLVERMSGGKRKRIDRGTDFPTTLEFFHPGNAVCSSSSSPPSADLLLLVTVYGENEAC